MRLLRYIPDAFDAFRWATLLDIRLRFPRERGQTEMVENSARCLAFNVHRCVFLDALAEYGARELTQVFCKSDDIIYAALPPTMRWERTKTLGRGDDCCNFR